MLAIGPGVLGVLGPAPRVRRVGWLAAGWHWRWVSGRPVGIRGWEYSRLMVFQTERRYTVIYSPLDLNAGLIGTPACNVQGYDPDRALRIMQNLLLYAGLPSADKARPERN